MFEYTHFEDLKEFWRDKEQEFSNLFIAFKTLNMPRSFCDFVHYSVYNFYSVHNVYKKYMSFQVHHLYRAELEFTTVIVEV